MKITPDLPSELTALNRPNSYIGRAVPRPNLARLTQGRGQYVSDVTLPRMAHVAFVRSPYAHARIAAIDTTTAKAAPGVIAVVTGAELAKVITPWVGVLTHLKGIKSAPQHAIAVDVARWQGERPSPIPRLRSTGLRPSSTRRSATISASSAAIRPAIPTAALRRRTKSSKRPSGSAATPGSPTSRAPPWRTGTRASNASPFTRGRKRPT